jgi:hypothetical protein
MTPDDDLVFIGHPPLFLPPEQPVRISVVFTWDIQTGLMLKKSWSAHYDDVQIGGPAFGDPGDEFEPGRFLKSGITITSRGCKRKCGFCFVPKREKGIRELEIKPGHILQDNNILACSDKHIDLVFGMLRRQKKAITFGGGLDARLFKDWHRDLFNSVKVKEMWFACDTKAGIKPLEKTGALLEDYKQNKKKCYTLLGWDKSETVKQAEERLIKVYDLGFEPFAQLYQPEKRTEYPKEWTDLQRKWTRPAIFKSFMGKLNAKRWAESARIVK